jgi:hypothetical protein
MESATDSGYCPLQNAYDSLILGSLGKSVNGLPPVDRRTMPCPLPWQVVRGYASLCPVGRIVRVHTKRRVDELG